MFTNINNIKVKDSNDNNNNNNFYNKNYEELKYLQIRLLKFHSSFNPPFYKMSL